MGAMLKEVLEEDEVLALICGVDLEENFDSTPIYASFNDVIEQIDVVIDFSSPDALKDELDWAVKHGVPVVLASTGYTDEDLKLINKAAESIAVFRTGNFSLGINLLVKLVKKVAQTLGEDFDVEIIEKHHNLKVDAPSGTALMLADGVNEAYGGVKPYLKGRDGKVGRRGNEIGIHAVRGGTIVGEHEVIFAGDDEIITLSHSARSKRVFAVGAVRAAKWIIGKPCGLYDMNDIFEEI